MNKTAQEAKNHLKIAQELSRRGYNPFKGLTKDQAIKKMRKIREKLWEKKIATRS